MPCPACPYPILIDGTGACPPEDVGGPWGYSDFIDALPIRTMSATLN